MALGLGFREGFTGSPKPIVGAYIFVMVNVPFPVQPPPPVSVQVPVIVLPFAVPVRASVLPAGVPDSTVSPKWPFTFPLKSPACVNEPFSVSPETKHGELVVKLKLKTFSEPLPLDCNEVPKANAVELPLPNKVAFQVPLMFDAFELFEPHPKSARPNTRTNATAKCFIKKKPPGSKSEGRF